MAEIIGLRAFARLVGVALASIQDAIEAGRITAVVQTPKGRKLYKAQALVQWKDSRLPGNNNRIGELAGDFGEAESGEPEGTADGGELRAEGGKGKKLNINEQLVVERTKLVNEQAKKTALERKELEGLLHNEDDVAAVWTDMLTRVRTRLLAMPSKLAPIIASRCKNKPVAIQSEIEQEVRQALTELAEHDGEKIRAQRARRLK